MPQGILLFAHGARDPAWALPFQAVRARLQSHAPTTPVELAFLEFMEPDLAAAGTRLVDQGCADVTVVPLFLGAGGHVRKDLPRLMDELRAAHPQTRWHLSVAAGETDVVVQALADAALMLANKATGADD